MYNNKLEARAAMRNRFQFNTKNIITSAGSEQQLHLLDLPADVLCIIISMLSRKDRGAFAGSAKRFTNITHNVNFREVKPSIERLFSTTTIPFTSLNNVESCLSNLVDYTYAFRLSSTSTSEPSLSMQLCLANSISLLLKYMHQIAVHSQSLTFKFTRGYQLIESNYAGTAAPQSRLHSNMADLSDTLRDISNSLMSYNTKPTNNIVTAFFTLFTCGIYQSFTPQENNLICLLLACKNALAHRLNELNKQVSAPINKIVMQTINRR